MTLGSGIKGYFGKKKQPAYPPQGVRCQKCLEYGHWSYECKGKRKYVHRTSKTQILKKKIKLIEEKQSKSLTISSVTASNAEFRTEKENDSSSDSSSTSSSTEEDSSSDSNSSSSNSATSTDTSSNSSDSE